MEHFDIILTIARIALDTGGDRATLQIERLRDALAKSDKSQAAKLGRLLTRAGRRHAMAPLSMEELRAATVEAARRQLPGETLSQSTPTPTDRETGTPLARVVFPNEVFANAPILNPALADAVKDLLSEWKRGEELARIGAKPHMRCLIYGPPGVGKTMLARYLARELGLPCVEARLDGLVSSFLGTTSRNIGTLFEFANRYRCVLFLDEFDAVAKARDDAQEMGEIKRVVNSLLQSLDNRNGTGITLAATNHEHLLDTAVWRRFDARIELQKPEPQTRELLLKHFLLPLSVGSQEMHLLVWATEGMSGSDIETLVEAGKRFLVLHVPQALAPGNGDDHSDSPVRTRQSLTLEVLRRQALLNSRLFDRDRAGPLTGSNDSLDLALEMAAFTQSERGEIFGLSQSAVSRLRKRK